MSTTAVVLLGVIAGATLAMAAIQVGLVIYARGLARKLDQLGTRIEQDIRPILAGASEVTANAVRASALAVTQVERVDRAFADLVERVDETTALIQHTILAPVREARALVAAVSAGLGALRASGSRPTPRHRVDDDDDPLFIG